MNGLGVGILLIATAYFTALGIEHLVSGTHLEGAALCVVGYCVYRLIPEQDFNKFIKELKGAIKR